MWGFLVTLTVLSLFKAISSTSIPTSIAIENNSVSQDPECPTTDTIDVFYPYDCHKFYHCVNGQKTLSSCPENMYFNPNTAECDFMDNVPCAISTTSAPSSTSTESPTRVTTASTTDNPVTKDPMCPATGTTDLFYPFDCTKFYHCVNGQKKISGCPENMYFNPNTAECDFMDNVPCAISTTSAPPSTSTESPTRVTTASTTDNPVTKDSMCPATGTIDLFYSYDCSKFYHCVNGQKTISSCPENMYFNPNTAECDFMDNVPCDISTTSNPMPPTTNATSTTSNPTSPTTNATPTTSNPTSPTTKAPSSICDGKPDGTFLPDPTNNRNYYRCTNGEAILLTCPPGTIWSENYLACVVGSVDF